MPGYHSKHQVIVAPWSYASDQQEQEQSQEEDPKTEDNSPVEQQSATTKTLDLSHPPPSYKDIHEEKVTNSEKQVCISFTVQFNEGTNFDTLFIPKNR